MNNNKTKIILGIETSCDDTAIAVVNSERKILSNIVINQNSEHIQHGGIVPEIAARAHLKLLEYALERALKKANKSLNEIDLICATGGPGLIGGLIVGTTFAKTLSLTLNKPYISVNHLEGHALTTRLINNISYPYLLLLVSGGHTQLLGVIAYGEYKRISTTLDDAAGETFDKGAKMLGLKHPGGPEIEKYSLKGDENSYIFPKPMYKSKNPNFSFSGLKTAFSRTISRINNIEKEKSNLAASLQFTISECILDRTKSALNIFKKMISNDKNIQLVVAGGVAANTKIRQELLEFSKQENIEFFAPPINLCTDNGAMIAWAGYEKFINLGSSKLDFKPRPRWPLDPTAHLLNPTMKIVGKKGIKS